MSPIAPNRLGTPSRPLQALLMSSHGPHQNPPPDPQLGDPVAWLNLTLADGRELGDVVLHRSPGGRWFFQGWGWLSADRRPTAGTQHCRREPLFMPHSRPSQ